MLLKKAAALKDDNAEYGIVWWGQSNARPWGHRDDEGFEEIPEMALSMPGIDLTVLSGAVEPSTVHATQHGAVGTRSKLTVLETLSAKQWVGAEFRLVHTVQGMAGEYSQVGAGEIYDNDANAIYVQWTVAFQANSTSVTLLANRGGYAALPGKFRGYDNIRVLLPYQPETPGEYSGGPAVPGYTFPEDITTNEDAGLFLPFCFHEGQEGIGAIGSVSSIAGLTMNAVGTPFTASLFDRGYVEVGNATDGITARGRIASSTTSAVTVTEWVGDPTGATSYGINVPHWRDNPNPTGYRYPSNDLQPGAVGNDAGDYDNLGRTYRRVLGQLSPAYNQLAESTATVSASIIATGNAVYVATAAGATVTIGYADIGGGVFRLLIQRDDANASTAAAGDQQFTTFLARGHIIAISGVTMSGPSTININSCKWRILAVNAAGGGIGSTLECVPVADSGLTDAQEAAFAAGTATIGPTVVNGSTTLTRRIVTVHYRFGCMVAAAWRLSAFLGKRIHVVYLGINGASQFPGARGQTVGFKGRIGWWNDEDCFDWTPSNPDGCFARLAKMVSVIAPAALSAEGSAKELRILGLVGFQGEAESWSDEFRAYYADFMIPFYESLRQVVEDAGLSPYKEPARIPFVHAQLSRNPWSLTEFEGYGIPLNGDTEELVNAAIEDVTKKDGFAGTFSTTTDPYTSGIDPLHLNGTTVFGLDPLHFNGFGECINARSVVTTLLPLIDYALSMGSDPKEVDLCNEALARIGHRPVVRSIEPPDNSAEASLCARFYQTSRDSLLESRNWKFATRRVELVEVDNDVRDDWSYAYLLPRDLMKATDVFGPQNLNDAASVADGAIVREADEEILPDLAAPSPYDMGVDSVGHQLLFTNQQDAILLYQARVSDTRLMSPLFREALTWILASKLAGPLIKGEAGAAEAKRCLSMAQYYLSQAATTDANQKLVKPPEDASWLRARG